MDNRDQLIKHLCDSLGDKWVNYGLEIVSTADAVLSKKQYVGNIEAYAATVLRNNIKKSALIDYKHKKNEVSAEGLYLEELSLVTTPEQSIFLDKFIADNLPDSDLKLFNLRFLEGKTKCELAEEFSCTEKTIRSRLKKLLSNLIMYLKDK